MQHIASHQGPLAHSPITIPLALKDFQVNFVSDYFSLTRGEFPFSKFVKFPQESKINWELEDNKLQAKNHQQSEWNEIQVLQAWLFFGLIAFVVRKDSSLLTFDKLTTSPGQGVRLLNTSELPKKLQTWHDWLKKERHKDKAKLHQYLIEVDRALELARRVIQKLFEAERKNLNTDGSRSFPPAKGHERGAYVPSPTSTNRDNTPMSSCAESDRAKLELCLMILGETLSAVKAHIMKDLGLKINGWFMDDEGWGPPLFVIAGMQSDKWCLRSQTVLRGQLGASAILLYAAYVNRETNTTDRSGKDDEHKDCKEDICLVVHKEAQPNASGETEIKYQTAHHDVLCPDRKQCNLLGPNMKTVTDILRNTDWTTEAEEFPLFRIVSEPGKTPNTVGKVRGVTVEKWNRQDKREVRNPEFTAISHVWSQGMGNEKANQLQECQLTLIRKVLDTGKRVDLDPDFRGDLLRATTIKDKSRISLSKYRLSAPFWMDTLAIPVKNEELLALLANANIPQADFVAYKQRAIRQIYYVFDSASRVFVVDKELCKNVGASTATQSLIKILTSHWMRRLWTLQEAFLSQHLSIVYRDPADEQEVDVQDLDEYLRQTETTNDGHTSMAFSLSLGELARRKLYHNMMGEDREIRNRKDHPILSRGSMVISSAWRSSHWRNTSRLEDETLTLSTLLNLDYRDTSIEHYIERASEIIKESEPKRKQMRQRMMRDFWILIHRTYEGSIPAGLIFLPGERLTLPGFGWAPGTWMSGRDESYPYPLSLVGKPTELRQEGLLIQYPGFLLHGGDPKLALAKPGQPRKLIFPTERHLSEWYMAEIISEDDPSKAADSILRRIEENVTPSVPMAPAENEGPADDNDKVLDQRNKPPEFGIILCRPKPGKSPAEIGVLVEVYRELWRRKEPERINKKIYCCQIIHRAVVSRIPEPIGPPESKNPTKAIGVQEERRDGGERFPITALFELDRGPIDPSDLNQGPIGEVMAEDTMWCVDGYQDIATRNELTRPTTPTGRKENGNSTMPEADGVVKAADRKALINLNVARPRGSSNGARQNRRASSGLAGTTSLIPYADTTSGLTVPAPNGTSAHPIEEIPHEELDEDGADQPTTNGNEIETHDSKRGGFSGWLGSFIFGNNKDDKKH